MAVHIHLSSPDLCIYRHLNPSRTTYKPGQECIWWCVLVCGCVLDRAILNLLQISWNWWLELSSRWKRHIWSPNLPSYHVTRMSRTSPRCNGLKLVTWFSYGIVLNVGKRINTVAPIRRILEAIPRNIRTVTGTGRPVRPPYQIIRRGVSRAKSGKTLALQFLDLLNLN